MLNQKILCGGSLSDPIGIGIITSAEFAGLLEAESTRGAVAWAGSALIDVFAAVASDCAAASRSSMAIGSE